jgi:hypothetical protein
MTDYIHRPTGAHEDMSIRGAIENEITQRWIAQA